jgi:hypothetical protein
MKKIIFFITTFLIFLTGYSQTKKEQISGLSFTVDSLNSIVSFQKSKNDSLIFIIDQNQKKIEELNNSIKLCENELKNFKEKSEKSVLKNKELEETIKILNSRLSLMKLSSDKINIIEINKTNYNLNVPIILDTAIFFKLNSEDFELKILRKTVDESNTSLDLKDENFNISNNIIVCILKNGEIKFVLEDEGNSFVDLQYLSNGKVILYLGYSAGGSGSKKLVYSISENANNIELNSIFDYTELDLELFSKDARQIIVFEAIWGENESHFDLHKYQIKLFNEIDGNYESIIIGTTKNKYDFDEMGLDARNALLLLKQKEPNLFVKLDLTRFL